MERKPQDNEPAAPVAIIGAEIRITGKIEASVDMMIDGIVDGDVICKTLTIGESGSVKGTVLADRARIAGKLDGSITAGDLAVEATGTLLGEGTYSRLKIATGGVIEGSLKRMAEEEPAPDTDKGSKSGPTHVVIQ